MSDRFTPIRGTESQILASEPTKGYIWFALDTKKIYYSDGTDFISMGGNSSVYYGNMILSEEPQEGQVEFEFQFLEIDGNEEDDINNVPNINDLILNIPDGCFYRVFNVDKDREVIIATKLTIAGSGTGGGTGGGTSLANYSYNRIGEGEPTVLYQTDCIIKFRYTAVDSQGESTGSAKGTVKIGGVTKLEFNATQGDNELNIGEYLALGENKVEVTLLANTGGSDFSITKRWTITTVSVALNWDYDEVFINYVTNPITFDWSVTGDVMKTTHIIIDDLYTIDSEPTKRQNTQNITIQPENLADYGLNHGAHKIEMYVTAQVGTSTVTTPSIFKNFIFVDTNSRQPIISCNFTETTLIQYNTVQIPIIIYNPESFNGVSRVMLRENGVLKDTWTDVANCSVRYWSYTPVVAEEKTLTIICNEAEKRLVFNVEALKINNEEIQGYAFKLKATDFSSNSALQDWESNGITATFSDNFDWINGGIKTEIDDKGESRQYICVKAGTTMTINYEMFGQFQRSLGKSIKVIFKATRCRDYNAQVLKCYNDNTNIGLLLRAQNAIYKSEQATIETQYCEDSYLEFETDIWKNPTTPTIVNGMDVTQRYIMTWLDGVPSGAKVYATNDSFVNHEQIIIGSEDCDVYLYLLKVYEKSLSNEEHLSNFIADSLNAKQMLERYQRNDILDETGEISYLKLAKANPDCLVHLYDVDHITTHKKKDIVSGCTYTQYHGSTEASLSAQNVTMKVQGTSSAKYGVAAFNLDCKFEDGFDYPDGSHTKKWAMTENAIPVNYFTTKVNVASCEQANNALNQEYYNRFQPYICKYRRKNPQARDTMQFTPGVLFIKDNNQTTDSTEREKNNAFKDTPGYVNKPYYKLYSICNMGNSKKNTDVFHDAENPFECCVEVTDNQTKGQWMTEIPAYIEEPGKDDPVYVGEITTGEVVIDKEGDEIVGMHIEGLTAEEYAQWDLACSDAAFEFRYPDGAATDSHKAAFFRFLKWMSLNDPSAKYEEISINSEEEFNKKINGYFADEEHQSDWVDPVILYTEHAASVGVTHRAATAYDAEETYYVVSSHPHGYTNEVLDESATFGSYTFKNTEFTENLKGLTISTYAGTYNTDCYEYRMAKMLSECEDYLIMDAVVFHYLFIERHTLIDNVAKNTFWSTEDLIHWGPLKDYDNDTADGNDNQGKLSLTYGYEALDPIADKFVFNAHQAVWLNFINGLQSACSTMYTKLNSVNPKYGSNAWDAEPYLKMFEDWQNCIPERVWIECYYRLYLRPREVYGAVEYIDMLEGGKKTHQRKQYETYQGLYIASKYTEGGSTIVIRGNGQNHLNYAIPVTVYSDCYLRTNWGQQRFNKRVKRGEVNNILCPIDNLNNATIYFHFAELYQTIGDLSGLFPEQFDSSAAIRLRELTLGGETSNDNLKGINFAGNTQLEKLVVRNCPGVTIPLELTGAIALKELDIRNSGFTGITIADGAPLEKLYVEAPSSMVLTNLKYLNDFRINSYNNISTLYFDNIDSSPGINSKTIVDNSSRLAFYGLKNVDWLINIASEINTDEETILVLDRLKALQGKDKLGNEVSSEESLTGILNITGTAYNSADSFNIYDKYAQDDVYPNLDIIFEGNVAQLHSIQIYDGNDELQWFRKITNGSDVNEIFLSDGPRGNFNISKIKKSSTESTDFEFANKWEIYDNEGILITTLENEIPEITNVEKDLIFKPVFNSNIRQYQVRFYNDNVLLNGGGIIFDYGTPLTEAMPKAIPYKDDRDLAFEETNAFIGYGLSKDSNTTVNENINITQNMDLYAIFSVKSVYDNPLSEKYIDFVLQNDNTYKITRKSGVDYTGKITLPIVHPVDGKIVSGIRDYGLQNQSYVTHIFWERKTGINNLVTNLGINSFQNDINLVYFEMPEQVTRIPDSCFYNCNSLFKGLNQSYVTNFFKNITSVGWFGCQMIGTNGITRLNTTLVLSEKLTQLSQAAFSSTGFSKVQIGSKGNPSQLDNNLCEGDLFINGYIPTDSFSIYVTDASSSNWTNLYSKFNLILSASGTYSVLYA